MAVRWAVSSGSWSSISTWNDGETLGIPTIGDTVYCNNYNITYDIAINLGNGWLRNDANSDYNILAGGRVQNTQNINLKITANCYAENSMLIYKTNASSNTWRDVIITGNCICPQVGNDALVASSNDVKAGIGIIIVGNVDISRGGSLIRNSLQNNFNITGNVLLGNGYIWESGSPGSQPIGAAGHLTNSITGNLTCLNNANGKVTNTHFVSNSIININNVNCGNGNIKLTTATNSAVYHINIANNLYTNGQFTAQSQCYVVINGNIDVSINNNNVIFATCLGFTCNGNINISGTGTLLNANIGQNSTMRIDGDITLRGNSSLLRGYATFLDLYSPNFYVDENITPLGSIANLTIPNDFAITYIGVTKPQIIALSKYQFDNTDQYPTPSNVKKDVPYAWGEKIGTYLPDYPPETVVLKDYAYDGGEMVGTLDLPQAPTTSDIVTAIKNDSDLGGKINDITANTENIKSDTENIISNTESIETSIAVANNKINDITTNTENIKSDTENIISNTNTIENIAEDIQINTNNILSESSSINNKSDSIITTLNNTSPQIDDLWNRLNDVLTARLGQSVTVEILEEVLTSQLNNQ